MAQDQVKQFLMQGINAARAGQKDQARQLFQNAIRLDPQNETAWLWMSSVARDNRERLFCLQNLLQINPQNEMALKGLQALGVDPAQLLQQQQQQAAAPIAGSAAVPVGVVPALSGEKLRAVLASVDDFLRGYNPMPPTPQAESWELKTRLRYGEALALRKRTMRYVSLGAGVATALLLVALVGYLVLSGGGGQLQIARRPTLTPSFTPTDTPTATPGVTNTPSPEPAQTEVAFQPPVGLPRGSIYGGTATPIFPPIPAGRGQAFINAVGLYSIGSYAQAFPTFEAERNLANNGPEGCSDVTYYYQIIGLAEQGGRQNLDDAQALYEDALDRPACSESTLIYTAACLTDYIRGLETDDESWLERARGWCDAAIEGQQTPAQAVGGDPRPIVLSITTRARLYLLADDYRSAAAILDEALAVWPADLNLLLVRARVEIERGDLSRALTFISQALYVDPASEPALRLRVEAYLDIAAQTDDPQRRIQLYGTAVIWTQEYLLFYPGEPAGYLLMARARLGEGNVALAEEALSRIITVANTLPDKDKEVISRAYALRAQIYLQTSRYEDALADTEVLLRDAPDDLALVEQQANLAYQLGRYQLALEGINTLLSADEADGELNRPDLRLRQLRIITQICEFTDEVECDYETAFEQLSDQFISSLDDAQQPEARSYRGKARYHLTMEAEEGELSQSQRTTAFQQALDDIEANLAVDDNGIDQYYRGLILEQLDNPGEALLAYNWVLYWSKFYDYPFLEQVQARAEAIRAELEGA